MTTHRINEHEIAFGDMSLPRQRLPKVDNALLDRYHAARQNVLVLGATQQMAAAAAAGSKPGTHRSGRGASLGAGPGRHRDSGVLAGRLRVQCFMTCAGCGGAPLLPRAVWPPPPYTNPRCGAGQQQPGPADSSSSAGKRARRDGRASGCRSPWQRHQPPRQQGSLRVRRWR
jgi:hypothetical protein